jgi:hypothetical protein
MKKAFAYAAIAVLLGATIVLSPFLVVPTFTPMESDTYREQPSPQNFAPENLKTWSAESESSAGVTPHYPRDALSVGLMLTFSLIFAFIVSSQLKKSAV